MLIALSIAVTSLVAISALRAQMVHQLDEEMKSSAPSLVQLATVRPSGNQEQSLSTYRLYLLDKDGNVLYSLKSEDSEQFSEPVLQGWTEEKVRKQNEEAVTVNSMGSSSDWRVLAVPIEANDTSGLSEEASLIIAMPLKQTNQVVALVGVLTFAFGLATLASAIAMTWVIVTRTFEPLARVEQTAAKVSIRGYSELYRQGALPTDEAVATAMSRIESESKRMGQLVEDLLTLARIDERRESKLAPFDLFNLAVDASNDAYATAPDRAVSLVGLNEEVAPTSATVLGDESRLRQVVANLLTNAMRYTPNGSPLEIAVGVREEVPGFPLSVLEVRDHGPGIHGEDRERVFERFYRTDTSRSRETGGTGLGLSIVAAIIEQHEGRIHIEETDGGGATFVISLQFYPPPVSDDQLMK